MSDSTLMFVYGAITVLATVTGLFFLRYWWLHRDRLFAWFAAAFWCLAISWGVRVTTAVRDENSAVVYLLRLAAYLLIIVAIVDKNRSRSHGDESR